MENELVAKLRKTAEPIALEWISVVAPIAGVALKTGVASMQTVSDSILASKIMRAIGTDQELLDWLKYSDLFQKSNPQYRETVTQLIYSIEAINEEKSLDVYSNLLHALKLELIDREQFFRLTWCLPQIYSQDLVLLKQLYGRTERLSGHSMQSLYNTGLLDGHSKTYMNIGPVTEVKLSELGLEMLRCGLCLDDYPCYSDNSLYKSIKHRSAKE